MACTLNLLMIWAAGGHRRYSGIAGSAVALQGSAPLTSLAPSIM